MQTAKARLFFNADRSELVHADDPDAAFFACAPGDDIPEGYKAPSGSGPDPDADQATLDQKAENERVAKEGNVPAKGGSKAKSEGE